MTSLIKPLTEAAHAIRTIKRQANRDRVIEPGATLGELFAMFTGIPGLRGFWPMASFDNGGNVYSLTNANADPLTYNGNPVFASWNGLVPYISGDGAGDFLSAADSARLDIIGNEGYITVPERGLSLGGWFYTNSLAAQAGLITKHNAATAAGSAYELALLTTGKVRFGLYTGATNTYDSTNTIGTGEWFFAAGVWRPSTEAKTMLNGTWTRYTSSIPATINNVAAPLNVGAYNSTSNFLNGAATLCFLSCMAVSETLISNLYSRSRMFFEP